MALNALIVCGKFSSKLLSIFNYVSVVIRVVSATHRASVFTNFSQDLFEGNVLNGGPRGI